MRLNRFVDRVQYLTLAACAFTLVMLFVHSPATIAVDQGAPNALGARLYGHHCSGCHGSKGQGTYAPRLAGGAVAADFPDPTDQAAVVAEGRDAMPSFADQLTAEEIAAVVAYTRSLP